MLSFADELHLSLTFHLLLFNFLVLTNQENENRVRFTIRVISSAHAALQTGFFHIIFYCFIVYTHTHIYIYIYIYIYIT